MAANNPQRGDIWEHRTTQGWYGIVGRATNKDPDGAIDGLVVYRALNHGAYYVRSLENFLERFAFIRSAATVQGVYDATIRGVVIGTK